MMMKPLQIGDKLAKLPLIQGGMGVGISSAANRDAAWSVRRWSVQKPLLIRTKIRFF